MMTLHRRIYLALLLLFGLLLPATASSVPISNTASGSCNGVPFTDSTINLNSTGGGGNAATDVTAEINPGATITSLNTSFTVATLPIFNPGDTGIDQITVAIPSDYSNIVAGAVNVGASTQVIGNDLIVNLSSKVTTSTLILINFTADAPATAGSATFAVSVDDLPTATAPQSALPGDADGVANNNSLDVIVTDGLNPFASTLTADPLIVLADNVSSSTLTATLVDTAGQPIVGETVNLATTLGVITPPGTTGPNGQAIGSIVSPAPGVATITATSGGVPLNQRAEVYFTQGLVLDIDKSANKKDVVIGDVITYQIEVRNTTANDIVQVNLADRLPPNFVYRKNSTTMDGNPIADPTGVRTLTFPIGTVPALVDSNSNGVADPGEPGYHIFSYQLIVSAGATPGTYTNTATATDVCDSCTISNSSQAEVEVNLDPLFDLGTIIGKVFEDKNGDGWQSVDEPGVSGAMVALDDGTYILTDPHGRYHFPAVTPGQRLLKINLLGLGNGAATTTGDTALVQITPGLLAKANFGITYHYQKEEIGGPVEYGMNMETVGGAKPIDIHGSVENQILLLSGQPLNFPGSDIQLRHNELEEVVNIVGGQLQDPILFLASPRNGEVPSSWQLDITDAADKQIKQFSGQGTIDPVRWDGKLESGELLKAGSIYQYQLTTDYADGTRTSSPRRMFGVDQTSAISMSLTGSAFSSGASDLSEAARKALNEAAGILRRNPHEKIIIEGHTDAIGSAARNMQLSQRRAEAALNYLTEVEGLPVNRFVTRWHGEEKPLASNTLEEGRELNRRVEIKGEYQKTERAQLLDQYHTPPLVAINGASREPKSDGRFHIQAEDYGTGQIDVTMMGSQGNTLQTRLSVPACEILRPRGAALLPFGLQSAEIRTAAEGSNASLDDSGTIIQTRLAGRTDPDNQVLFEGAPLTVTADGFFSMSLNLKAGSNHVDLLIRNSENFTRLAGLDINVATRNEAGGHIVFAEPVPYLSVKMPPTDRPLNSDVFVISGETDAGNRVEINGKPVRVLRDGHFTTVLNLPKGKSPVRIEVTNPLGHYGAIERTAEISDTRLFFLAFADSKVSQLKASGNIENSGLDSNSEVVTEGRLALYLKGTIAGKYLLTAALDTGQGELDDIFSDLDESENDRLLTNLDPDKYYPVYGDSSQLVYDTESQGKLYLALDSDELQLLLGNYQLNLAGGELATYRRTLYGAHAVYRSKERTRYGDARSEIELFGAEVKQLHIRDEIDATGGSLYYLSQNDVIEGSEQIAIIVRDKLTGLRLANLPQEEGLDYTIKYPEGRILFRRPISSVQPDERVSDSAILAGNPVIVQIDYEAQIESFEKTAVGARARQQVGDHIAIGGTVVQDELDNGAYEMWGIDSEVKLGEATRLLGEYAESSGAESAVNVSNDGGLSYQSVTRFGSDSGAAWKAAAEIDLGEWISRPDRHQVKLYHKEIESGFHSAGHNSEEGTSKSGILLRLRPTDADTLLLRYDIEERDVTQATAIELLSSATVQWQHQQGPWRLTSEYQANESETLGGLTVDDQFAAVRLEYESGTGLLAWIEQQQTLSGIDNDQSSVGIDYQLNSIISMHASATDGTTGQAAEGGISINLGNSRAYVTQRLNETKAERSTTTVVGGEQKSDKIGRIYSEYQWARSNTGYHNLSIVGAEKGWDLQSGLHLFVGGELSKASTDDNESKRTSIASGISYKFRELFRISSRNEIRRETGTTDRRQFLTINKAETVLNQSFTLLGTYRFSKTENQSTGFDENGFEETSIGLAWRPINNDRFNALARVTRLTNEEPVIAGSQMLNETVLETAAIEWSLQINRALEWVEKEALRWKEEDDSTGSFASRSWLSIHRLNILFRTDIDIGLEYRTLTEDATDSQKQGWLSEIGWRPKKHFRLGFGYNFTDFSDDERSLNDYSVEGWFIRAQGMY